MSLLTWLQRYSKEIVLVTTTVIATTTTAKTVVNQEDAKRLLGNETPLEKLTRQLIGAFLITCGSTLKSTPFVHPDFRDQVGSQLQLIGYLLEDYEVPTEKKEAD